MKHLFSILALFIFTTTSYCQELTTFPGFFGYKYYEDENQISKQEFKALILKDQEANALWRKSQKHQGISLACLAAGLGFAIWGLEDEDQIAAPVGLLVSSGALLGFSYSSLNLKKKAILKYNQNNTASMNLNFGVSRNGVGLVCQF